MAFNITEFKTALQYDGQRPSLFNVQFEGRTPCEDDGSMIPVDLDLLTFRACSFKYDGVRKIVISVIEDEDFTSLALLRKFKESTWPSIEVHTYAKNGAVTSSHKFSIVKSTIAYGTELSWDDNDSLMTWTVTMDSIGTITGS